MTCKIAASFARDPAYDKCLQLMDIDWPVASESSVFVPDMLDIWAVPLDTLRLEEVVSELNAAERERAATYLIEEPRRQFVGTRVALRRLLSRCLGVAAEDVAFETGERGKPRLAHSFGTPQFNVAHSGELALIAITQNAAVGVDVERLRSVSDSKKLARRYFHSREIEEVCAAAREQRDERFLRCWTRKEAIVKATGRGVAGGLSNFWVPTGELTAAIVELPGTGNANHSQYWLYGLKPCAGYIAAVACFEERQLRCFRFEW